MVCRDRIYHGSVGVWREDETSGHIVSSVRKCATRGSLHLSTSEGSSFNLRPMRDREPMPCIAWMIRNQRSDSPKTKDQSVP